MSEEGTSGSAGGTPEGGVTVALTANDEFKRNSTITPIGVILAVALHFSLFAFSQPFEAEEFDLTVEELTAVRPPPQVEIPPPPQQIRRPATPRVSRVEISEEVTIPATTFDANPPTDLPPPPPGADPADRPVFIAREVDAALTNRSSVEGALDRYYPPRLRQQNIEGSVTVQIYVLTDGSVGKKTIAESSGYQEFDAAALEIVEVMEFTPAYNRDEPVAVWLTMPIEFVIN